jgi:hypothetical protein
VGFLNSGSLVVVVNGSIILGMTNDMPIVQIVHMARNAIAKPHPKIKPSRNFFSIRIPHGT